MGFEGRSFDKKPREVKHAIFDGNVEKRMNMARAGGRATARIKNIERIKNEIEQEMHVQSMYDAAVERNEIDELAPPDP